MATFIAKVRNKKGQLRSLTLEASTPFEAKKFLRKCGLRPLELQVKNSINHGELLRGAAALQPHQDEREPRLPQGLLRRFGLGPREANDVGSERERAR